MSPKKYSNTSHENWLLKTARNMKIKQCTIIEDDLLMIEVLTAIIEKDVRLGLSSTYTSSNKAIIGVFKDRPDILFLDINLPGLDGIDVMDLLKSKQATIIVSSDNDRFSEFSKYENVVGFLEKPIDSNHYNQLVDKAIDFLDPKHIVV